MTADLEAMVARARAAKELADKATPETADDVLALVERLDREMNQFICLNCGIGVKADGDGCCVTCGMDVLALDNGQLINGDAVKNAIIDAVSDCRDKDMEQAFMACDAEVERLQRLTAERDAAHAVTRKELHDARGELQKLSYRVDLSEAKREALIAEIRGIADSLFLDPRLRDRVLEIAERGGGKVKTE